MRPPLNESKFIRVYRELTGASEAQARSAFMFACCAEDAWADVIGDPVTILPLAPRWEESSLESDTDQLHARNPAGFTPANAARLIADAMA